MRAQKSYYGTKLWLSASDTYEWAHKTGAAWPCSELSGSRLFVEFDLHGDLVDITIDGKNDVDCDRNELEAITRDFLRAQFGPDHPAIRD